MKKWKELFIGVMADGGAYAEDLAGALEAITELREEVDKLRDELAELRKQAVQP